MIITPKVRSNIFLSVHPVGVQRETQRQIEYVQKHHYPQSHIKNVLILGASMGYGFASRIVCAHGLKANTLGVSFEKAPTVDKLGSPGWYYNSAFEEQTPLGQHYTLNVDAFSLEAKEKVAKIIKKTFGNIDLIIYSLASPKRTDPKTGETYTSVLKTSQKDIVMPTLDAFEPSLGQKTVPEASSEEIKHTIKVMGGEDFEMWIDFLKEKNLLAPEALSIAYSYVGPEITYPVYREGTIGKAKEDLEARVKKVDQKLKASGMRAVISINKALVTRASAVIPGVSVYMALLYQIMKKRGTHEDAIAQISRLFETKITPDVKNMLERKIEVDDNGWIRLDDWEMEKEVQDEIKKMWPIISSENYQSYFDIEGFKEEFLRAHGFGIAGIDYEKDVSPLAVVPSEIQIQKLLCE